MRVLIAVLLTVAILFSANLVFATPDSEAGVTPVEVPGNPLSGDGADNHKIDSPSGGETGTIEIPCDVTLEDLGHDYPDVSENKTIEIEWEVSTDKKSLSWQSTDQVSSVIVKGGDSANVYYYFDPVTGDYLGLWNADTGYWYDSGLQAPDMTNPQGKVITPEISNFGFFANCPGDDNGGNGNGGNGSNGGNGGSNGNGGGGVFVGFEMPTSAPVTKISLPRTDTDQTNLMIASGLLVLFLGLGLFFRKQLA